MRDVCEADDALSVEVSKFRFDLSRLATPREALVERQDETFWSSVCDFDELISKEKLRRPLASLLVEPDACVRIKKDAATLSTCSKVRPSVSPTGKHFG